MTPNLTFKQLKIELSGSFWGIREFEVEGMDVKEKWQWDPDKKNTSFVSLTDFPCSEDKMLDLYVYMIAPNSTPVTAKITGSVYSDSLKKINYEEIFFVRYGYARIMITKSIDELINIDLE
jgi:hypothetical protein